HGIPRRWDGVASGRTIARPQAVTMRPMAQTIGVVLAGGGGRPFGGGKAEARRGGAPLAERAARALRPLCGSVVISIAKGGANPAPGHATIEDVTPRTGPLGGFAAVVVATGEAEL